MSDTVIKVDNLSKSYNIRHQNEEPYTTLRDILVNGVKGMGNRLLKHTNGHVDTTREEFWALNDVSFEVKQGERVGIIGRNGAGKSTLLKILSRITEPTKGRVHIKGRVASLLEVGTGFHPELTGRENIYLNGAILGMSREEIRRKFDEIVAFAEVDKFLDTPVKRYSSGMYVRLAFAVAAHLEPEILVVDEVLAVGDTAFQKKSLGKMENASREGRTVLIVSHNMPVVQALCNQGILLHNGSIITSGSIDLVTTRYLSFATSDLSNELQVELPFEFPGREPNTQAIIKQIALARSDDNLSRTFRTGELVKIRLSIVPTYSFNQPTFGIGVNSSMGHRIFTSSTLFYANQLPIINQPCTVQCVIPSLPLAPGQYSIDVSAGNGQEDLIDHVKSAISFEIIPTDYFGSGILPSRTQGSLVIDTAWEIAGQMQMELA